MFFLQADKSMSVSFCFCLILLLTGQRVTMFYPAHLSFGTLHAVFFTNGGIGGRYEYSITNAPGSGRLLHRTKYIEKRGKP